ncbi:helix-turn-helix domain-containing protein [Tritonibacter mobilis]|uniref:helix-turn-helix domain-containing protein n=1 Tax=Tritonibacter mobilis TaxID=379347 RepID=UPI000E0CC79C|nr:RodZ domain-containing protein [Tritonibacter mobilis]
MIGRLTQRTFGRREDTPEPPRGFDDFELRLGDMMRGERATMGKSLLDVQRELRIKASYIDAIENCDPTVFDTPGFIAGYVRSYARYLNMDPEKAFAGFCAESGFSVAHGMSSEASVRKPRDMAAASSNGLGGDAFSNSATPFVPVTDSFLSQIDPRAIGSLLVLATVIGGLGFGGWKILHEVQQVTFAPVEQTPEVLAELDPLASATLAAAELTEDPATEALDRLYRPQALDVPVLVARDAPISTLDPRAHGNFAGFEQPGIALADAMVPANEYTDLAVPQVLEDRAPSVEMIAVRPSWVQVKAADGSVIFETIMEPGQTFEVPLTEDAPQLRTGESSAIYFAVNGQHYGPVGGRGQVTKNVDLSPDALSGRFQIADLEAEQNQALATMVAQLRATQTSPVTNSD